MSFDFRIRFLMASKTGRLKRRRVIREREVIDLTDDGDDVNVSRVLDVDLTLVDELISCPVCRERMKRPMTISVTRKPLSVFALGELTRFIWDHVDMHEGRLRIVVEGLNEEADWSRFFPPNQ
ncbi:hypothetical protein GALMADRAFT_213562 [Galerina marginata CBS 339.88]|uniref:Uncharacterized protein n=1 Tax=Galerina marginata (strain CBS 339.88) TaxID=685588 RepID=A0A067SQ06_GALM3|nr:hypothetical protein GALMADRAFT_213562 [Galerina marginata CBS 339.88]